MANPTTTTTKGNSPKTRILLVEDNPGDVYLLEKSLNSRELNYELTRYADGEQAILALQKKGLRRS
jgi:CheY-like chemotaxis protein